jgi:hypothetical protein
MHFLDALLKRLESYYGILRWFKWIWDHLTHIRTAYLFSHQHYRYSEFSYYETHYSLKIQKLKNFYFIRNITQKNHNFL